MKFSEAKDIIAEKGVRTGFIVTFEVRRNSMLHSDHFPDVREGEPGIKTETEAWDLARAFAKAKHDHEVVNVYVCSARDFTPVAGYSGFLLNRYPSK
jgi:hypothetical protein